MRPVRQPAQAHPIGRLAQPAPAPPHIVPRWAGRTVGSLSRSEIQEWVGVQAAGKSATVVIRNLGILRGICDGVETPRKRRRKRTHLTAGQLVQARKRVRRQGHARARPARVKVGRDGGTSCGGRRFPAASAVGHEVGDNRRESTVGNRVVVFASAASDLDRIARLTLASSSLKGSMILLNGGLYPLRSPEAFPCCKKHRSSQRWPD